MWECNQFVLIYTCVVGSVISDVEEYNRVNQRSFSSKPCKGLTHFETYAVNPLEH
jgi:hypothetical protein